MLSLRLLLRPRNGPRRISTDQRVMQMDAVCLALGEGNDEVHGGFVEDVF
jgi:hypothetical protein